MERNPARTSGADSAMVREPWTAHPRLGECEYGITDAVVVGTIELAAASWRPESLRFRLRPAGQRPRVDPLGGRRRRLEAVDRLPVRADASTGLGQILRVAAQGDRYDSAEFTDVPLLDAAATYDEERGRSAVFLANRSQDEPVSVEIDCRGAPDVAGGTASCLSLPEEADPSVTNRDRHDTLVPRAAQCRLRQRLPPAEPARLCPGPPSSWKAPRTP